MGSRCNKKMFICDISVKLSTKNKKIMFMLCIKCNPWKKKIYLNAINFFDFVCTFKYERFFVQSGDKILKEICHLEFHLHLLNKLE
jgi:hypothetical protein